METREFLSAARIDGELMAAWIESGWLAPHCKSGEFLDVDVARAHFISDLADIGVNNEGIPVILDLVDQLHGLRRALREALSAINTQPDSQEHRMPSHLRDPR